jgi:hypothetical protein
MGKRGEWVGKPIYLRCGGLLSKIVYHPSSQLGSIIALSIECIDHPPSPLLVP